MSSITKSPLIIAPNEWTFVDCKANGDNDFSSIHSGPIREGYVVVFIDKSAKVAIFTHISPYSDLDSLASIVQALSKKNLSFQTFSATLFGGWKGYDLSIKHQTSIVEKLKMFGVTSIDETNTCQQAIDYRVRIRQNHLDDFQFGVELDLDGLEIKTSSEEERRETNTYLNKVACDEMLLGLTLSTFANRSAEVAIALVNVPSLAERKISYDKETPFAKALKTLSPIS